MDEIFLDTSKYIYYLRKQLLKWENFKESVDFRLRVMHRITRNLIEKSEGFSLFLNLKNANLSTTKGSPVFLRQQLYEALEPQRERFVDKVWDSVNQVFDGDIERIRIPKEILDNLDNVYFQPDSHKLSTGLESQESGDVLMNLNECCIEGCVEALSVAECEFILYALNFVGLSEVVVSNSEECNLFLLLFDELNYENAFHYTDKCMEFLSGNDVSYMLLATNEVNKEQLNVMACFSPRGRIKE